MDERKTLPSLSVQMSLGCTLYTITCLMTLNQSGGRPGWYYPLVLLFYAPAIYGFNRLLLRRPRTLRALVLWNGGAYLLLFTSVLLINGWQGLAHMVFAALFCLWITAQGTQLCLEPPTLSQLILRLDVCLLFLVIFVGYTAALEFDLLWNLPIVIGCACAIVGVISSRVGGRLGGRGRAVMAAAFLIILGLVWLLVRFVAAPAGGGFVALWETVLSALKALGHLVSKILLFLFSLLPQPEGEMALEPQEGAAQLPPDETVLEVSPVVTAVVVGMALIAAGVAVFFLLRALGRLRVGGKTAVMVKAGPTRKRLSFFQGVRNLLAAWKQSLRLRLWLWRNRDTPAGLFFVLDRRCRSGPWRRSPGETPREFLLRLGRAAQGDQALSAALSELVIAVDTALYAPPVNAKPLPPVSGASLIRRRIGRAVRRQFLQQSLARFSKKSNA